MYHSRRNFNGVIRKKKITYSNGTLDILNELLIIFEREYNN